MSCKAPLEHSTLFDLLNVSKAFVNSLFQGKLKCLDVFPEVSFVLASHELTNWSVCV